MTDESKPIYHNLPVAGVGGLRALCSARGIRPGGKAPAFATKPELIAALEAFDGTEITMLEVPAMDPQPAADPEPMLFTPAADPAQRRPAMRLANREPAPPEPVANGRGEAADLLARAVAMLSTGGADDKLRGEFEGFKTGTNSALQELTGATRNLVKDVHSINGALEILEAAVKEAGASVHRIVVNGIEVGEIEGAVHSKFADVLLNVKAGVPTLLIGETGCGKSHLARQIANGIAARKFGFISLSQGVSEAYILGRFIPGDAGRYQYQESPFVEIYRLGGVFLFDELDAADSNVLLVINGAIGNGHLTLPNGEVVDRHQDFVCLAAANTWGRGADRQYSGRNQLDEATLNRFESGQVMIEYDAGLEAKIVGPKYAGFCKVVQEVRKIAADRKVRRPVSTRFIANGCRLQEAGMTELQVLARLFLNWSSNERQMVRSATTNPTIAKAIALVE